MEVEIITILDSEEEEDDISSLQTTLLARSPILKDEKSEAGREEGEETNTTLEATPEEEEEVRGQAVPAPASMLNQVSAVTNEEEAAEAISGYEPSWTAAIGACDFRFNDGFVRTKTMPADGQCMYRAILHQRAPRSRQRVLPSDQEVEDLRKQVATFMRENEELLVEFLAQEGLDETIRSVEEGEWGDSMALYAVSNLWSVRVEVYMELGPLIEHTPLDKDAVAPRPIRLAYRCADEDVGLVYNHYDSVLEVALDLPPSAPQCTAASPPRRPTATLTPRRSPRRSPRHSPRAKRARTDPAADGGPSWSAQELMDRTSPTPGLLAPGSPNTGEASASQEASQQLSQRASQGAFQETFEGSVETPLAAEVSPIPHVETPPSPSCPSMAPSLDQGSFLPSKKPSAIPLLQAPLSREEITAQWIEELSLAVQENDDCDLEPEDDFHLYMPDLHPENQRELADDHVAEDSTCFMSDVQTQFSTVCGTIVQCLCIPGSSRPYIAPFEPRIPTVTESINVMLSNGKLVGTCQSIYQ